MGQIYERLQDLTGNESGAVLFPDGDILIVNWSAIEGIPRIFTIEGIPRIYTNGFAIGLGEKFTAEPCDPPEIVIEAMREDEWNTSGTFSKDGWKAWTVTTTDGVVLTVVTQKSWN